MQNTYRKYRNMRNKLTGTSHLMTMLCNQLMKKIIVIETEPGHPGRSTFTQYQ